MECQPDRTIRTQNEWPWPLLCMKTRDDLMAIAWYSLTLAPRVQLHRRFALYDWQSLIVPIDYSTDSVMRYACLEFGHLINGMECVK